MVLGDESGVAKVDKTPATPRENEDLLAMLRTRWTDGAFSDIKVIIFDREYLLHRMVLCRSPFFDRLLQGDWNETHDRVLRLEVPAATITCEAFELSLSHMYANPVDLDQNNVFQVMAAASYLDLPDLCTQCSEFIIDSMHYPEAFLEFYSSGTEFEYGPHSDRIKKSGWHHLCMMGVDHLRGILAKLDIQTIKRLLISDEFWIRTELDRYKLVKEVLFPKLLAAREQCKEHGGVGGMPHWLVPSLGSPRDPWISSDAFGRSREKLDGGTSNNQGSSTSPNHLLDSAEIKEESPGHHDTQAASAGDPSSLPEGGELMDTDDGGGAVSSRFEQDTQLTDDPTHQGNKEQRMDEDVADKLSASTAKDGSDSQGREEQEGEQRGAFGMSETQNDASDQPKLKQTAAIGVREILQAASDVLGLEGIKYSHIQHADLSKIEIELHEMGLNRAHHALLQGMRTQDILYKRIEASTAVPEQPTTQSGRSGSYPKNLHPYSQKDLQDLYSRWWLPSFRSPRRIITPDPYGRRIDKIGGMQVAFDSRDVVCTRFKFLVPSRDGMAARSSRPGRFQQKKGRGWNDFLHLDNIENFLTPWGSLRVIVIVYPPFETE